MAVCFIFKLKDLVLGVHFSQMRGRDNVPLAIGDHVRHTTVGSGMWIFSLIRCENLKLICNCYNCLQASPRLALMFEV